jgi:hypothetical protein
MMSCRSPESVWIVLFRVMKPSKMVDGCQCLGEIHCLKSSSTLTMEVPASSETMVTVYQINNKNNFNQHGNLKSHLGNCSIEVSTKSLRLHERRHFTVFGYDVMNGPNHWNKTTN